jgi:hypothetical protein
MGLIAWFSGKGSKKAAPNDPAPKQLESAQTIDAGPRSHQSKRALASKIGGESKDVGEKADKMMSDYQVKFAYRVLSANIHAIAVAITLDGDNPQAEILRASFQKAWERSLPQMLPSISHGRVAFEKVFNEFNPKTGLTTIRCLDALPYKETSMLLTADGDFDGIEVEVDKRKVQIPQYKAWWLSLDSTIMQPHGKSQFLGAPADAYDRRMNTLKRLDIFMRRWAVRGRTFVIPSTIKDESGRIWNYPEKLMATLDDLDSGGDLIFPHDGGDNGSDSVKILETTEVLNTEPILAVLSQGENEQLLSMGIPPKTVTEGNAVGSYAMITEQALVLYAVVDGLMCQFVTSFKEGVIDPTITLNYLPGEEPQIDITFPRLAQRPDSILSQIVIAMFGSTQLNELILSGAVDIQKMLDDAGIPCAQDVSARLQNLIDKMIAKGQTFGQTNVAVPGQAGSTSVPTVKTQLALSVPVDPKAVPVDVPTELELQTATIERVAALHTQFAALCRSKKWSDAAKILRTIRELQADATTAGRIVGALCPWKPSLQYIPGRAVAPREILKLAATIAPAAFSHDKPFRGWNFPWLDEAVRWLDSKQAMPSSLQAMQSVDRTKVFKAYGLTDTDALNKLKWSLTGSLENNEDLVAAKRSAEGMFGATLSKVGLSDSDFENLFRTNTHQAFINGMSGTLNNPAVKAAFPGIQYFATRDSKTRQWHLWLDRKFFSIGSEAYALVQKALMAWSCRCAQVSASAEQIEAGVVTHIDDIPQWVIDGINKDYESL